MQVKINNFRNINSKSFEVSNLLKLNGKNKSSCIYAIIFCLYGNVDILRNNITSNINKNKTSIKIIEPGIHWIEKIYSFTINRIYENNTYTLSLFMEIKNDSTKPRIIKSYENNNAQKIINKIYGTYMQFRSTFYKEKEGCYFINLTSEQRTNYLLSTTYSNYKILQDYKNKVFTDQLNVNITDEEIDYNVKIEKLKKDGVYKRLLYVQNNYNTDKINNESIRELEEEIKSVNSRNKSLIINLITELEVLKTFFKELLDSPSPSVIITDDKIAENENKLKKLIISGFQCPSCTESLILNYDDSSSNKFNIKESTEDHPKINLIKYNNSNDNIDTNNTVEVKVNNHSNYKSILNNIENIEVKIKDLSNNADNNIFKLKITLDDYKLFNKYGFIDNVKYLEIAKKKKYISSRNNLINIQEKLLKIEEIIIKNSIKSINTILKKYSKLIQITLFVETTNKYIISIKYNKGNLVLENIDEFNTNEQKEIHSTLIFAFSEYFNISIILFDINSNYKFPNFENIRRVIYT